MTADTWAIIGTGIAIIAANAGTFAWLRGDIAKLGDRVTAMEIELRERMACMEGKMDLLLQGLQIRITPKDPAS